MESQHECPVSGQGNLAAVQLQTLIKSVRPEILEMGVAEGMKLLHRLKETIHNRLAGDANAEQRLRQIDNLTKHALDTKTVIGVVGNTGAGKSSVLNALLDEERLVPTNCMRACTAVVTELAYNSEDIPYCAKIEFIETSDWEAELKLLLQDLVTDGGTLSSECTKEDTDAGIAYAKIKAVYPEKTREDIATTSINSMVKDISHILGSSCEIKDTDPARFYRRLQMYVDSKEKTVGRKVTKKPKEGQPVSEKELWPLIKVVRLYVKSAALSTGLVLADLPGTHDSNPARAAIAENFMKSASGLFIVSPINRAVDDKAAKSLLGESFKRQLKMDGGFDSITFVCSKTDDISVTEAQDSLGLEDEMAPLHERLKELGSKQVALAEEFMSLREAKASYDQIVTEIDEEMEIWEDLLVLVQDGHEAFAPDLKPSRKRKLAMRSLASKRQRQSTDNDANSTPSFDSPEPSDITEEEGYIEPSEAGLPLTIEKVMAKLIELRATRKEARTLINVVGNSKKAIEGQQKEARAAEALIGAEITTACIAGRNTYSKRAIALDYASGVKELDQELAQQENQDFDPDEQIRDYDQLARDLPVFCVSSRGYQKLCGRFPKDAPIVGFKSVGDTEIPLLQQHCAKLTEAGRVANGHKFLLKLLQLLNSLALWTSSEDPRIEMTEEQKARAEKHLTGSMDRLRAELDQVVQSTAKDLSKEISNFVFDKHGLAVSNAMSYAVKTVQNWARPINWVHREMGGYPYPTYKAICRRNGVYTSKGVSHDWNQALAEPMIKIILPGWEKAFSHQLPMIVTRFARLALDVLRSFHAEVAGRAQASGCGPVALETLQQQVVVYDDVFKDATTTVKQSINTSQREINREFIPTIQEALRPVYESCVNEHGPGTFKRMKDTMDSQVHTKRFSMFQASVDHVKKRLLSMIKVQEKALADKVEEVLAAIHKDYSPILGCGPEQESLAEAQRTVRKEISEILEAAGETFRLVVTTPEKDDHVAVVADDVPEVEAQAEAAVKAETGHLQEMLAIPLGGIVKEEIKLQDVLDAQGQTPPMECSTGHDAAMPDVPQFASPTLARSKVPSLPPLSMKPANPPVTRAWSAGFDPNEHASSQRRDSSELGSILVDMVHRNQVPDLQYLPPSVRDASESEI